MPKPAKEFRGGNGIKVTIWRNTSDKKVSYAVQVTRSYQKDGNWVEGNFWAEDIPALIHTLERAQAWIEQSQERDTADSPPTESREIPPF